MSVIIPAFNEERYLCATLSSIGAAVERLRRERGGTVELLVVDNGSTDRTAAIAREMGATVHYEQDHNIAKVRNVGADKARGPSSFSSTPIRSCPGTSSRGWPT